MRELFARYALACAVSLALATSLAQNAAPGVVRWAEGAFLGGWDQRCNQAIALKTCSMDSPVGLFHPLQHAGLSRRSPVCRQTGTYGATARI